MHLIHWNLTRVGKKKDIFAPTFNNFFMQISELHGCDATYIKLLYSSSAASIPFFLLCLIIGYAFVKSPIFITKVPCPCSCWRPWNVTPLCRVICILCRLVLPYLAVLSISLICFSLSAPFSSTWDSFRFAQVFNCFILILCS